MGRKKNNLGCFGTILLFSFYMIAFSIAIYAGGLALVIAVFVGFIYLLFKLSVLFSGKIINLINEAHKKRKSKTEIHQINNTKEAEKDNAIKPRKKIFKYKEPIIEFNKECEPEEDIIVNDTEEEIPENYLVEEKNFNWERYAVMCNAYIEHQEEIEQYKSNK